MSQRSFGGSSVYSSDSTWTTTYKRIPKKQPMAIRFLSWAAGAPSGATALKKRTRDFDDDRSVRSGGSSFSYWNEPETQLYWVAHPHGYDYSGGSRGSNAGSSRSKRSGRSSKGSGGGSRKHFDGAVPRPSVQPMGMPMPMPMNAGPPPPPAPMGPPMGGGFDPGFEGGYDDGVYDQGQGYDPGYGGGYSPAHMHGPTPPMPPPPMNAPMPDAAPFINVTGQNQPGNPFQGGRSGPRSESEWSSDWSDQEM
ncbi:uncharacterized protein FIESC28_01191 [Fusarium coffeatum]|uniref:Uncharacterized protein n=1 Tax=Fusarium coffeatum TaxID=231269 RepID=A0A366SAH6_9HYPO|nr:uncharacterized protein FIESC28_01191 [Fusarium coffeatum]RBR25918.1 hypothetical protein FIESC28_01191 [Fusarium coffeatum]